MGHYGVSGGSTGVDRSGWGAARMKEGWDNFMSSSTTETSKTRRTAVTRASATPGRRPVQALSLLLGLVLFVAACGGDAATPTTGTTTTTTTTGAAGAGQATTTTATTTARTTTTAAGATTAGTTGATGTTARTTAPAAATTRTGTTGTGTAGASTPNTAIRIAGPFPGEANTLTGSGATFPQVLYSRWFEEYNRLTQVQINYQGTGSSAGKNAIRDGAVDFAGSDSPMSQQELDAARARCGETILHIPTTLGSIVLAYNIPNLTLPANTNLRLDGETIAGIFLEQIRRWNDPRIAALNPGVNLPNQEIITVHRSDGSGTTQNFTEYLSAANEAWRNGPRAGTTVQWPGGIGANGNPGVANEVKNNPYAIGYIELAFAKQNNLAFADVRNREGQFVTPNAQSVQAAGQALAPTLPQDLRGFITNAPGAQSYPITAVTWILVCPRQTDQAKATALTRALWWALTDGQQFNERLDYAPLPPALVARGQEFINQITVNGQRAFPGR